MPRIPRSLFQTKGKTDMGACFTSTLRSRIGTFSGLQSLPDLVQHLNAFQPVLLVGYPSIMALLSRPGPCSLLRRRQEKRLLK